MTKVYIMVKINPARTDEFRYPDDGKPVGEFMRVFGSAYKAKNCLDRFSRKERKYIKILQREIVLE